MGSKAGLLAPILDNQLTVNRLDGRAIDHPRMEEHMRYLNTNDRFGFEGPYESESKEKLADEMNETFKTWADELYCQDTNGEFNSETGEYDKPDRDEFIKSAIADMRKEFIAGLVENPTIKQMRKAIVDKYSAIPERQISTGNYLHTVGRKYVTILTTLGGSELIRQGVEDFYAEHF
jgi:hypothetical protein